MSLASLGKLHSEVGNLAEPSDSAVVLVAYCRFAEDFAVAMFDFEQQKLLKRLSKLSAGAVRTTKQLQFAS
jgi:hypothetical protein